MAGKTKIDWADSVWNPIVGCSVVSPGCTNCYAMKMAARLEAMARAHCAQRANATEAFGPLGHYLYSTQRSKAGPVWTGRVALAPDSVLTAPLHWKKPRRIFVNSMGDLFHESVPDEWIDRVFTVMAMAPQHTFMVLTKRADRMHRYMSVLTCGDGYRPYVRRPGWTSIDPRDGNKVFLLEAGLSWPLPNVWLGVSVERQQEADERIPHLLDTPAAVRFISAEPLLGPIDLLRTLRPGDTWDYLTGERESAGGKTTTAKLDWVIAGGESGPDARPMHPEWARGLRDQCAAANVPFFFKGWGNWLPGQNEVYDGFGDGRLVARHQDGVWGPRDIKQFKRNYVTWGEDGSIHHGKREVGSRVAAWAQRVGKKRAGRLLDGVEHNDIPCTKEQSHVPSA